MPDCDRHWQFNGKRMAEVHEDESKRAALVAALLAECDLAHAETGTAELEN
jgi:hypothetical protein